MTTRQELLRRAGAGAAGFSLAQLLGPAAALAGDGGGDYPAHPRWRFAFVSHSTLDPLLVATQFGAQDAAALVKCQVEWTGSPSGSATQTVKALRAAIAKKVDGIAVSVLDDKLYAPAIAAADKAGIPLVAFRVDAGTSHHYAYVGESPRVSGAHVGGEIARLAPRSSVLLFAPAKSEAWSDRRLEGVIAGLAGATRAPSAVVIRLSGDVKAQQGQIEKAYAKQKGVRGLFAVEGIGTAAIARAIKSLGVQGLRGGGYDLLPDDLKYVADGTLEFVVDQQPYVQGFAPVIQLFLAKMSEGIVVPWDTETSVLLRKADVATALATKSRFEGSSSRHEYPLRKA